LSHICKHILPLETLRLGLQIVSNVLLEVLKRHEHAADSARACSADHRVRAAEPLPSFQQALGLLGAFSERMILC
jgi:hypothetical protein